MDNTKTWDQLETGISFNQRLDPPYYDKVDVNWEMFKGNQYVNSGAKDDLPKPVFNIIKRIITFFVASLTATPVDVKFSTFSTGMGDDAVTEDDIELLNASFDNFMENVKFQSLIRDGYKDGAITGDWAYHMVFDNEAKDFDGKYSGAEGSLILELVDGANVYLGNPNSTDLDKQPCIIITGRDTTKALQEEYAMHHGKDDSDNVESDNDTQHQVGYDSRVEIEGEDGSGKATYAYKYTLKKADKGAEYKTVHVSKSVKELEIFEEIDTGLKKYPVAWGNWERQKNNYHGLALCTRIIPNQIFINRMFAMAMKSLMDTAFPKAVYDRDRITNLSNKIGQAIGVTKLRQGERASDLIDYIQPGEMSNQISNMVDMAWSYTKETLGANDAMMGDVNPEQASGAAITVTAKQSAVPLLNPKNNMYDTVERIAEIYLDCVTNYYGERAVVREESVKGEDGKEVKERIVSMFDFEKLADTFLTVKVDVGASTYYDELSKIMTYENYLSNGWITFKEALEALPADYFPNKDEILQRVNMDMEVQEQAQVPQGVPYEVVAEVISQMSPEMQQAAAEYIDQAMASLQQPAEVV